MKNILSKIAAFIKTESKLRSEKIRLEFVLSDYCNLNCKGCTHYSPLAPKEFQSLDQLESSMKHLGSIVGNHHIGKVYIMGGETLLYPNLPEVMKLMAKYFPKQERYIFTNGILLGRMGQEFWDAVRDYDFILSITRYPINFDYDKIEQLCRQKGVRVNEFADRTVSNSFLRFGLDPQKSQNKYVSHLKCYNRGCLSVIGNKVYPCSLSGCVSHLNKALGTGFRHQEGDYLNVTDIRSVKQLRRLRDWPVPFCSYCVNPATEVKYGPSKRRADEWVDQA